MAKNNACLRRSDSTTSCGPIDAAADQLFVNRQLPRSSAVDRVRCVGSRLVEDAVGVAQSEVEHGALADAVAVHQWPRPRLEHAPAERLASPVRLQQDFDVPVLLDAVDLVIELERRVNAGEERVL